MVEINGAFFCLLNADSSSLHHLSAEGKVPNGITLKIIYVD